MLGNGIDDLCFKTELYKIGYDDVWSANGVIPIDYKILKPKRIIEFVIEIYKTVKGGEYK